MVIANSRGCCNKSKNPDHIPHSGLSGCFAKSLFFVSATRLCVAAKIAGGLRLATTASVDYAALTSPSGRDRPCSAAWVQVPESSSKSCLSLAVLASQAKSIASFAYSQNSSVSDISTLRAPTSSLALLGQKSSVQNCSPRACSARADSVGFPGRSR